MASPSKRIDIIIQYSPPHIPLRAVSSQVLKLTERNEPFMEYLKDQLVKNGVYEGPFFASNQLSRAVRFGDSFLVNLLMRLDTDPHIPHMWWVSDSDDNEMLVEETPFETAMNRGNWDALVVFVARGLPSSFKFSASTLRRLPWNRFNKEARAYFQHLKEERDHEHHEHIISKQDYRRELEDTRRAKEDVRRARYNLRRAHMMGKRQQREVEVTEEEEEHQGEVEVTEEEVAYSTRPAETVEVFEVGSHGGHSSAAEVQKVLGAEAEDEQQLDAVIMRSRLDIHQLSDDEVVLLRLTRCSQTPETVHILQTSPQLAHCHRRVQEAGCEFAPSWAGGAKFFVPVTQKQLDELAETGFQIKKDHVLALREDKAIIEDALDNRLRGKNRVKVRPEHGWPEEDEEEQPLLVEEVNYSTDSEMGFSMWPGTGSSGIAAMHSDT